MTWTLSLQGATGIQMSHSYQLYRHVALKCVCEHSHSAQGVQIVPLAANHWNPKPQRDRLPAKLSPLGFPSGLYMECNGDYAFCHTTYSLNPHISLGLLSSTQMIDVQNLSINCTYTISSCTLLVERLEQMAEWCFHSDAMLAISVSRDNHTVWAHYSRQRVIAYLLDTDISIEMD